MKAMTITAARKANVAEIITLVFPKSGSRHAFAFANELLASGDMVGAAAWTNYARAMFEVEELQAVRFGGGNSPVPPPKYSVGGNQRRINTGSTT
jgi:hypothetical protein